MTRATILLICLALAGCAAPMADDTYGGTGGTGGKADVSDIDASSLFEDARNLDRYDLLHLGVGFATDELNNQLEADFEHGRISGNIHAPTLYALDSAVEDDLTLESIDSVVTGLTARYGANELSTEVNSIRREWLSRNPDYVYAETGFDVGGYLNPNWSFETGGFEDGWANVGFLLGAQIEARVIAPYKSEWRGGTRSMLRAVKEFGHVLPDGEGGFILPRRVSDMRAMHPGEVIALHGEGSVGVNLGAGAPITIMEPTAGLTYNMTVSGGVTARFEGDLDIQLVRLEGDELIVDVGMERAKVASIFLQVDDNWGVSGLVDAHVDVGPFSIDVGKLVEKAIERQLNRELDLFGARASYSAETSRMSISRFRFRLDHVDGEAEQALAQLLKGGVRYAQALANANHPGVLAELDLVRTARTRTAHAGVHVFGMQFFKENEIDRGVVTIQTPTGAQTVAFDMDRWNSGKAFSTHGHRRTVVSSLVFDRNDPMHPQGEANLLIQLTVDDSRLQRDKMLDHLDSLIIGVAGWSSFGLLESYGNQIQAYMRYCNNDDAPDGCREERMNSSQVDTWRREGYEAFMGSIISLEGDAQALMGEAARQRLATQVAGGLGGSFDGPSSEILVDFRVDDQALDHILANTTPEQFRAAVEHVVAVTEASRAPLSCERAIDCNNGALVASDRASELSSKRDRIDEMVEQFERARRSYASLVATSEREVSGLGALGEGVQVIRFPVDRDNLPVYEEAAIASLAHTRALVAGEMFDRIEESAGGLFGSDAGRQEEQTATYSLIALLGDDMTWVRTRLEMDLDSDFFHDVSNYADAGYEEFDRTHVGNGVSLITAGSFSIDSLTR